MRVYGTYMRALKKIARRIAPGGLDDRVFRIASLGTIVAGLLACLASVGIGVGLILAGTIVFAEV